MKWQKKGLIWGPDGSMDWAQNSALQPTPFIVSKDVIRIFVGCRDDLGVGRIGFVDVNAGDPSEIIRVSEQPVLDIGTDGSFDDNGVIPCSIFRHEGKIFLFYAGYQLVKKVRFHVFGGLSRSEDGGNSFQRVTNVPVLERSDDALLFKVLHSILYDDGKWKVWYGAGDEFRKKDDHTYPVYNIRYLETDDLMNMRKPDIVCIDLEGSDEHRVGRPYVVKTDSGYQMFYCAGTISQGYRLAYAESDDGRNWIRKDDQIGIDVSPGSWDSNMIAYPSVVSINDRRYLFYNGNKYGYDGFGYAEFVGDND